MKDMNEELNRLCREAEHVARDAKSLAQALRRVVGGVRPVKAPTVMSNATWGLLSPHCSTTKDRSDFVSRKMLFALYSGVCAARGIEICGSRMFLRKLRAIGGPIGGLHEGQDKALGRGYRKLKIKQTAILKYLL